MRVMPVRKDGAAIFYLCHDRFYLCVSVSYFCADATQRHLECLASHKDEKVLQDHGQLKLRQS